MLVYCCDSLILNYFNENLLYCSFFFCSSIESVTFKLSLLCLHVYSKVQQPALTIILVDKPNYQQEIPKLYYFKRFLDSLFTIDLTVNAKLNLQTKHVLELEVAQISDLFARDLDCLSSFEHCS